MTYNTVILVRAIALIVVLFLALALFRLIITLAKAVNSRVALTHVRDDPVEVGIASGVEVEPATTGLDPDHEDRAPNVLHRRTYNAVHDDGNTVQYWMGRKWNNEEENFYKDEEKTSLGYQSGGDDDESVVESRNEDGDMD
jgi:hypothetical protein